MRFFVKLILGMILFNAFILLLVPFFPNHAIISSNAVNVTSEYGSKYDPSYNMVDIITGIFTDPTVLFIFGTLIAAGVGIGLILTGSHNIPLYVGISIIVATISALYISTIKVFSSIADDYPLVLGLLSIMTLIIGIFFIFSVGDLLTGRSDVS